MSIIPQVTNYTQIFGDYEEVYEYRTIGNELLGYVVRKMRGGKKTFMPWSYQEGKWIPKWYPDSPKPIYNIQALSLNPGRPVMIVEGEKTADAATNLFPSYNIICWMSGARAYKKVDFSCLSGLDVTLFPDNDEPGYDAMEGILNRLEDIAANIYFIDIKKLTDDSGWDLADLEFGVVDFEDIQIMVQECQPYTFALKILDPSSFPIKTAKGNPLNTYENVEHLCNHYNIKPRFNTIRKEINLDIPHKNFTLANKSQLEFEELKSLCIKNNVPRADLVEWITMIADNNHFNPVENYITSAPWDGVSRINDFMNTIQCKDNTLRDSYIFRWMIGAIAVGLSNAGLAHPGVLTFVGKQAKGKSSWVRSLAPENLNLIVGDATLNPDDKDSVIRLTKYWIVELAEADATVNRSESAAQKAFLSRKIDLYRRPYDRMDTESPRHTCFIGTVNDAHFLKDETGNRRWWVLEVESINYQHGLNMQQVWAEFKTYYDRGEQFHLNSDEFETLMNENESYKTMSVIEERIRLRFDWDSNYKYQRFTALQVLDHCGFDTTTNRNNLAKESNRILKMLCQENPKKIGGIFYYELPRSLIMPGG